MCTTSLKSPSVNATKSFLPRLASALLSAAILVATVWPAHAQAQTQLRALFVYAGATMNASDLAISNRLATLGYRVQAVLDTASATAQAATNDLIVVSSTVGSGNLLASGAYKYLASTVPVINWESANLDDLRMTSTAAGRFGSQGSQTSINIVRTDHPLAAGQPLGTNVIVTSAQTIQYGVALPNAIVIARQVGDDNRAVLFAYERDDVLFGGTVAAERRIAVPLDSNTFAAANTNLIALFDAAVRWANPTNPAPVFVREPADATVAETRSVSFTCEANGARPFSFQWLKNNTAIEGATGRTLTFAPNLSDNGATISVRVTNASGNVTSRAAKLTVTEDKSAPTIVSVTGSTTFTDVTIKFSKPLLPATATNLPNYAFFPAALGITGAKLSADRTTVVLSTTPQTPGATYTLLVFSVRDATAAVTPIDPGTEVSFSAWVLSRGVLLAERFDDIAGNTVADLIKVPKFVDNQPDSTRYITSFNSRTDDVPELNGERVSGYFTPPSSGLYRFFIRSDDASQLFMNTNSANSTAASGKVLIAKEDACCNAYGSTAAGGPRVSPDIALTAGQRYYIEALLKEGTGGDYVQVAFREKAISGNPPNVEFIPGVYLSSFANPDGASITITQQPQSVNMTEGGGANATFSVAATAVTLTSTDHPIAYQWQRNGVEIIGANGSSYSTAATPSNNGAKYRALLMIPGKEVLSQEATLTVTPDTTAPSLISANTYTRTDKVTVTFSEPVSVATATKTDNYSLNNGVRVTSATRIEPNKVELAVTTAPAPAATTPPAGAPAGTTPAAPLAYEGFDYPAGEIPGKTGGTGWGAAWQTNGSPANSSLVQAGSLSYTDARGNTLVTSGGRAYFTGTNNTAQPFRELPSVLTNSGTTAWFSFIGARIGRTTNNLVAAETNNIYPRAANVSLFNSTLAASSEQLAVGGSSGAPTNTWALLPDGSLANRRGSLAAMDQVSFVVVRVDFKDGNDDAYLWVNPSLDAEPSIASAEAKSTGAFDYSFNRIRPFAGNTQATRPYAELLVDELRVGLSYGSVAPFDKPAPGAETTLIAINEIQNWRYENTGNDLGTSWKEKNFDDRSWGIGKALLAFETGATAEPIRTQLVRRKPGSTANDIITDYFRTHFTFNGDPQTTMLIIRHVVDDGVALYLNGQEVHRFFLPATGPITSSTVAVPSDHENRYEGPFVIPSSALVVGDNVLAAEVHQNNTTSSDMVFGLELKAAPAPPPSIGLNFGANEARGVLASTNIAGVASIAQANWNNLGGQTGSTNKIVADVGGTAAATPVNVEWNSNNTWASTGRGEENNRFATNGADRVLMTGYLDTTASSTTAITIGNIPPALTSGAGYDVYVYILGGVPNKGGGYRILDGKTRAVLKGYVIAGASANPTNHVAVPVGLPPGQVGTGTYIVFAGLSAPTIVVEATTAGGLGFGTTAFRAPINAVQIVPSRPYKLGLNFGSNEQDSSLTPKDVAGVASVAQANWNNLNGQNGSTNKVVVDISGSSQPVDTSVIWASNGTWANLAAAGRTENNNAFPTNSPNRVLMRGYLDTGNTTTTSVTISNLPPQLSSGGYDVYVYTLGGVSARGGAYRIVDAASGAVLKDYVLAQSPANPNSLVQVPILPVPQYGAGTYLLFSGLGASAIRIEATTVVPFGFSGTPRAPINAVQLVTPSSGPPAASGPLPTDGLRLTINSIQDLAEKPNTIAANAQLVINNDPAAPAEFGRLLSAYQTDFSGSSLPAGWVARGATNVYSVTNGYLRVSTAAGDPNHLLYEVAGYNQTNQEVLARIRIVNFGPNGDQPRGGIGVGVGTNSQGINLHFRDSNQTDGGTTVNGRHIRTLDDLRAWGPGFDFRPVGPNRWVTNNWYWLRLKQQPDLASGRMDVFGKAWLANGTVPEPADWQITWDRYPAATVRAGFAGITAGSAGGVSVFDVDYVMIKADGLSTIKAGGSDLAPKQALFVTGATPSAGDRVVSNRLVTLGYKVTSVTAPAVTTGHASGMSVIVVSSTVSSGDMLSGGVHKFRDTAVPLMNYESANYDDLGMTGTASTEFGTTATQTSINIIRAGHPLAAGLPAGTNVIFTSAQTTTWGIPLPNAIVIARSVGSDTQAVIFGYEQGDVLFDGRRAAERRLGFVLDDASPTAANAATAALFDAAIRWLDTEDPTLAITRDPADTSVTENTTATFSVEPNGARPFSYQWFKNNAAIADASSRTLTVPVAMSDNGAVFTVRVTNPVGNVTSKGAKVTVTADKAAPAVVSATTRGNPNGVTVVFSKPIADTAFDPANYSVSGGINVFAAGPGRDNRTVVLTTADIPEGRALTLTIKDVTDRAAVPNKIAPNPTTVSLNTSQSLLAFLAFNGIPGNSVADLINNPKFRSGQADEVLFMSEFNTRSVYPNDSHEGYGAWIAGYYIPPSNGVYRFFIRSDDASQLWMSTNNATSQDPTKKVLVAREDACCNNYGATAAGGPRVSPEIAMNGGQKYWVEAYLKEGTGGDFLQVAVREKAVTGNPPNTESIPGSQLSSPIASGAVEITAHPVTATATESQPATFSVAAVGTPPYGYQWYNNGIAIAGANGATYTIPRVTLAHQTAFISVLVTNAFSVAASDPATVKVLPDTTPPILISVSGGPSLTEATLAFNEPLDPASANNAANYSVAGLNVVAAKLGADSQTVVLTTAPQQPGIEYTVTAKGVRDSTSGRNAANSIGRFTSWVPASGYLLREVYNNIGGVLVSDLTNNPKFPNSPDVIDLAATFETPSSGGAPDNYGVRLTGFIIPPTTGDYVFYISGDDQCHLFLSSDESPSNRQLIAQEPAWNGARQWVVTDRRNAANPENRSAPIPLVAGKRYYVEALMKEGGGGDHLGVTWRAPGQPVPANGAPVIPGEFLATAANPAGASINFQQQPQSVAVSDGNTVTLSVAAQGVTRQSKTQPVRYQWQRNSANIPGATNASLTTPPLKVADTATYRVVLSIPGAVATSQDAVVTVTRDTVAPTLVSASSYARTDRVTVVFSEAVSNTATNAANYAINNNVTVRSVTRATANSVDLTTTALAAGQFHILTVNNVQDVAGNPIRVRSRILIDTNPAVPSDFGLVVSGYQDDFSSPTLNPNWIRRGPSPNIYSLTNGVLRVVSAAGDPNHLVYQGPYSSTTQEVLARIRVLEFGTGDPARAGIGTAINTNSQGINLHFRDLNQDAGGVSINGRHVRLLDDNRAWGPGFDFRPVGTNRWVTNTWYWLRLRHEVNLGTGQADAFGKAWLADGTAPEPADWQVRWDRYPAAAPRTGSGLFAGITGGSINGISVFEVDYVLIKAEGLPGINVESSAFALLGSRRGSGDLQLLNLQPTRRDNTVVLADEGRKDALSIIKIEDGVVVQFPASPGRTYKIQASNDLKTWTDIGSATGSAQGRGQFLDPETTNIEQRFYRTLSP